MKDTKVKESFICYFDLLGYKEYLRIKGEEQYLKLVNVIVESIIKSIQDINYRLSTFMETYHLSKKAFINYRIFSDNVIMAVEMVGNDYFNVKILQTIVSHVAELQTHLLLRYEATIRGAIIKGNVYFDKNFVFGEGLIQSYIYENDLAIYPRMLIDNECNKLLSKEMRLKRQFVEYMDAWIDVTSDTYEYVLQDGDGFYFVNYLFNEKSREEIAKNIKGHKRAISKLLESAENLRIYQKYSWCCSYHNKVCEKYRFQEKI